MTSQTEQQITTIYLLLNTSKSKDNQKMKFGQLIQHNRRSILWQFLKNCTQNVRKYHISGSTVWNFIKFVVVVCANRGLPKYTIRCWLPAFTLDTAFLTNKKRSELVSLPHFLHNLWRKTFFSLYFINLLNFTA